MFHYGKKQAQEVLPITENLRHEIYQNGDGAFHFIGLMTHQLEARRMVEEDNAMDILKQKMSALQEQKMAKS